MQFIDYLILLVHMMVYLVILTEYCVNEDQYLWFYYSADHGQPFSFQLGIGQVIKGWDQGLLDMCIGEKRKLTIPSHLGYGDQGAGGSSVFDLWLESF